MDMNIFSELLSNLDFTYIILCNVITYIVINFVTTAFPAFDFKTIYKRLVSAVSAIILGLIMTGYFGHNSEPVFYGFFMQFITWDYVFKGWLQKLTKVMGNDNKHGHMHYGNANSAEELELDA